MESREDWEIELNQPQDIHIRGVNNRTAITNCPPEQDDWWVCFDGVKVIVREHIQNLPVGYWTCETVSVMKYRLGLGYSLNDLLKKDFQQWN